MNRQLGAKGRPRVSKCPERPPESVIILSHGVNFAGDDVQGTKIRKVSNLLNTIVIVECSIPEIAVRKALW